MVELILGICDNCGEQLINKYWCKDCRVKYFIQRFTTWTSENDELNDFIQESQLNAKEEHGYFRWFSYDIFENIQMIGGNEGFSEVYYAMIKNDELCVMNFDRFCPPKYLDAPDSRLPEVVVLKRIINSGYMIKEFMKMVKNYYVCMDETIPKCYGITKDPLTQDYVLVLQYANMKSLNDPNTLVNFSSSLPWAKKKEMFNTCVQALKIFHESNLVHSNLHPGNILLNESYSGSSKLTRNLYISDLEMCHPIDEQERLTSSRTFGVMPFIAPEILKGGKHTKSSNIYSLGMIFWCIISGELPYTLEAHDSFLAYEICKGKRPTIPRGTPKDFVELLNQCWESDPSKRPSINTIAFTLNWSAVSDGESMVYHSNDFYQHHPNACYSSRPIDFDFTYIDQIKPYI